MQAAMTHLYKSHRSIGCTGLLLLMEGGSTKKTGKGTLQTPFCSQKSAICLFGPPQQLLVSPGSCQLLLGLRSTGDSASKHLPSARLNHSSFILHQWKRHTGALISDVIEIPGKPCMPDLLTLLSIKACTLRTLVLSKAVWVPFVHKQMWVGNKMRKSVQYWVSALTLRWKLRHWFTYGGNSFLEILQF